MTGLGGLNKSKHGVVMGLVQLQLPVVKTPADLAAQTLRICEMVAKARRNQGTMDLVVFPEYSLHGLSMDTSPAIMCSLGGPEVLKLSEVARPEPLQTEVLVKVHAAGINPVDWKTREGNGMAGVLGDPPFVLGWDVSGVVAEVRIIFT